MLTIMSLQCIKQFFGFFNLTPYEKDLIEELKHGLPLDWVDILNSQLGLFNKVDRVIEPANQLPFGHTSFYWVKFGKARFDYPKKFPSTASSETLATLEVVSHKDDNLIKVEFGLVYGFLFTMKYYSGNGKFIPESGYTFQNFQLLLENEGSQEVT
jgi:hypothetical protein